MSKNSVKISVVAMVLTILSSACQPARNVEVAESLQLTMKEAYQGVKDGNVEWIPLPENTAYITVDICIENPGITDQSIKSRDVYITTEDREEIHPVAVGFDQAEAFSWLLPLGEPIGVKRIAHQYYFFVIQNDEVMNILARQSLGCDTSFQYKSLALLFLVPKEAAGRPLTLYFLGGKINFTAKRIILIPAGVKWGKGLGVLIILVISTFIFVRKRAAKAHTFLSEVKDQDEVQR